MDDPQIIHLLHSKDETALRAIREAHGLTCMKLAQRILGSREDAEECFDDALLLLWERCPADVGNLQAYLVTLVRHTALDRLKAAQSEKRGGRQFHAALDELEASIPSADDVEKETDAAELRRVMQAFLETLPQKTQRVFVQRYFLALPVGDIAKQNDMGISAAKMLLMRTRHQLKVYLKKEGLP